MLAAYPQQQQQQRGSRSSTNLSLNLNVFNRYPSSLSSACGALQPRLTTPTSEDEEEEEEDSAESISGSSEGGDDDRMLLDGNARPTTTTLNVTQPRRLQLQQIPSSDTVTVKNSNSNPLPHQPAPPAPIIVTYGPFHNPDVDVAVAYAQMVCYLWFWSPSNPNTNASFDPAQWTLQLQPHPHFIHFLGKVITQTQLSKTVLVLALHYLWLLKRPVMVGSGEDDAAQEGAAAHEMGPVNRPSALAQAPADGSQYTVSVIALMLANKFMDDNTYTNKSWAAICGVTLEKINSMEREFLIAINHALHVDVNRFISWIRIMQSFFIQRQSRFDSRSRRIVRLPHHSNQYSHHHSNNDSSTPYRPSRAHSRPRMNVHSDDGHGHQSDVSLYSNAGGNSNAVYGRARSVSPKVFQFTFVPPTAIEQQQQQQQAQAQLSDNTLNVPLPHGGIRHDPQRPFTGIDQRPSRPFTGQGYGGSYATLYRDEMEAHGIGANANTTTTVVSSRAQQWSMDMSTPMEPSPILVNVPSSRSKRSASQAFSPKSAEPPRPRPRPEERDRDRERQSQAQNGQVLAHPHPVRRVKPQFAGWNSHSHHHQHSNNLYPYQEQLHYSHQPHQHQYHPHLTSYPNPSGHHHHHHPVRRMNQVHEILASSSRASTAVEAGFARMSLSSSSHGPSPVSDAGPSRQHLYSQGSHSRSQLSLHSHSQLTVPSQSQLVAPFDPYTAPTFRNEGATEDEPLRLQFYQLVQGGRGVLRCQPMVNIGLQVSSQGEVVYSEGVDVSPHEREYEYEYAMRERERERFSAGSTMHPPSLAFSTPTPTDDDEGMSSSESSNGTGWECQHQQHPSHLHAHQQQQLRLQSQPQPQPQPQVVGGGYSLPPLSTLLAETQQHHFASPTPSAHVQASQTPMHENVKYAEFANAGPPASYVPQWGLFSSPSGATPYGNNNAHRNTTMTAFQSPVGMESSGLSHLDLPQSHVYARTDYGRRV